MTKQWQISRRTALKGLGTAMALPLLDAMLPAAALAGNAAAGSVAPTRLAFWFVPNGVHMPDWTPQADGSGFDLPSILEPLAAHREQLMVLSGLTHDKARANGDGPGDHARSSACFLTGCQPFKTAGANIRVGVSADQIAAQEIGRTTRFASLELGCERGRQAGSCDSGYSCAYSSNISWRTESTPMGKETNPRLVFERLFAEGDEANKSRFEREHYKKSVLDFVREDASRLNGRLGRTDRRKLDEYFASVREIEQRIERSEEFAAVEVPDYDKPEGIPDAYEDHIRLMADLQALAFQTNVTRVSTFMLANEGSNRPYPFIEVSEGHHDLSHHGNDAEKQAKISKINLFHMRQFAYYLDRLAQVQEGEGTLLDHAMIVYGSGIGDGNRHNHDDLPILLVGRGGGALSPGRHLRYSKETPLNNLYLSLLDRLGIEVEVLGDGNGRLDGLSA